MNTKAIAKKEKPSLIERYAGKIGVDPEKLLATLRATVFKARGNDPPATNEEMMALLLVAAKYNLDPFTKELFAFRDKGGIVPIISVDGWVRMLQEKRTFQGMQFAYDDEGEWVECTMYRSDRKHPFTVREYLRECSRDTPAWKSHPRRMMRHRAMVQCARITYGFSGVYLDDEGEVIALAGGVDLLPSGKPHVQPPQAKTAEPAPINEAQLEEIRERLAKTGVPDNLVLAKFEVGGFEQLKFEQADEVCRFIMDNAP